jgi:acetyl-CoA C-acetyltransferase
MVNVVLAGPVRTPVGKFGQALREIPAPRLGALVVTEALRRAGVSVERVGEVIMGNVVSAGEGQAPARQAALYAGIPPAVGAVTVNKVCGSGLKAVMLASQAIRAGDAQVIVAGGMESMSNAPYLLRHARWGMGYGDARAVDAVIHDGLWDVYNDFHMGMTGEIIAERYKITRQQADEFAYRSHMKAARATREGKFKEETLPIDVVTSDGRRGKFEVDEGVRPDTTPAKLGRLKSVFKPGGILTAGNSSQLSDGAAVVVALSEEAADRLNVHPVARVVAYGTGGMTPENVMEAPIPTVRALLDRTGFSIDEMDLVEHNEAYATASLAVGQELGIQAKRLNVHGGAVALGHPLGCSGARVLVTLLFALQQYRKKRGLATLCLGGGNAVAMIVERL